MNNKKWLAVYLYYNEPWETFLKQGVFPIVKKIIGEQFADEYFFIRYWEKGPHVRLRFKGDEKILSTKIKPILIKHFNRFFADNPSQREELKMHESVSEKFSLHPNNSIQFIEYEPEIERYGGEFGILIAEKQFMNSSNAILEIIDETEKFTYDMAMGTAIQLHLSFAFALGFNIEEIKSFFGFTSTCWFSRAIPNYYKLTDDEKKSHGKEVRKAFADSYENQKKVLMPFIESFLKRLKYNELNSQIINRWMQNMNQIRKDLENLIEKEQLIVNLNYYKDIKKHENTSLFKAITILESYVHMANNRLGILNRDEAFLGYLINQTLNDLPERI